MNLVAESQIAQTLTRLVRESNLAVEILTEEQLVEAIRQAIAAGDFQRNVTSDGRQSVVYLPWREVERLQTKYNELLYAVARVRPNETRHETALRYIREAEANAKESDCRVLGLPG